jgi:hypothetical protein
MVGLDIMADDNVVVNVTAGKKRLATAFFVGHNAEMS